MPRKCVNKGGPDSIVRLAGLPSLEEETALAASASEALKCWEARPGEILTVVDPQSTPYRARITSVDEGTCVPFEQLPSAESSLHIEVIQAIPDKERFELVLQKLTELGVNTVLPVESQHSATLEERDAQQKKSHRWPDVIGKAARQCRRAMLPELMAPQPFAEAVSANEAELKLMLYEGETAWSFVEGFGSLKPQSVALLIGPEGGFSPEEVEMAQGVGFLPVSLGPRIMRTETAAIVAAALVQSYLGDLK